MSTPATISPPRTILQAYRSLPEGTMAQLIQNQIIMSPAPLDRHQRYIDEIYPVLSFFVKKGKLGITRVAPYDVYFDREYVYQPDILFISNERKHLIEKDGLYGAPDLIIEILTPSTAQYGLKEKKEVYEKYGVKEYWIVNPEDNNVAGFTLEKGKFIPLPTSVGKIQSVLLGWKVDFDDY